VHGRHFVLEEGSREMRFSGAVISTFATRDASTHDRKRIAKRKHESAYAHRGDVGRQERNGGEKVQEGGVCPEALHHSRQFPDSGTRAFGVRGRGGGGYSHELQARRTMHFPPIQGQW
jgi:hypothetical protein